VRAAACRPFETVSAIARVHKYADHHGLGHKLMQKSQLLGLYCKGKQAHAGGIAARTVEAGDEAKLGRVDGAHEHDRDGGGRRLGS
jgi:hypothetical protein